MIYLIFSVGVFRNLAAPHTLINLLKHNEALHQRILLLSVINVETPLVESEDRLRITDLGLGFYRVEARYGFMETPDVGRVVELLTARKLIDDIHNASFILGRETLLATGTNTMAQWRKYLFILMSRNAWNATSFSGLPPERLIEIGIQLEL